jgi:hypothetical protein
MRGKLLSVGAAAVYLSVATSFAFADELKWIYLPTPPGTKFARIQGSSKEAGPWVFQLIYPPHSTVPLYYHSKDIEISVLSGTLYSGNSAPPAIGNGVAHKAGVKWVLPAMTPQWLMTGDDGATLQAAAQGPVTTAFVK